MEDDPAGITDELWDDLVDLGWTSLLVPEAHGGGGAGLVDVVPVLEEMGRVPFPGPFSSSAVLATLAARTPRPRRPAGSLAAGATRGTIALDEQGHGDPVDRIRTRATRRSGRWHLDRRQARRARRPHRRLVPGAGPHPGRHRDLPRRGARRRARCRRGTRSARLGRLDLDERPAEPVGRRGDHTAAWRRIADDGAVAVCAELIGSMERANELAVEYAKARVQFDRPIATFQVIKHKAADMLHRLELSRVGHPLRRLGVRRRRPRPGAGRGDGQGATWPRRRST